MSEEVLIVHCIDTEGPMYESLEATFERINYIFDLSIDCTEENLKLIQNMELDLNGKEEGVRNVASKNRISMKSSWLEIDKMLDQIRSKNFRNQFKDSYGGGWVYSWFCVDHVGFTGLNPRKRIIGHHSIFDHYFPLQDNGDIVQWHYHPLPANGNYHANGIAYLNSSNIWEVLARKVIDRQWFPSVFRPGFHVERPDSHWFLEQWIPFDYANQSSANQENHTDQSQLDMANHRYGNWERATSEWRAYHPSHNDYQLEGSCKRSIFRILNMEARIREINLIDVEQAFERASSGQSAVLSFANHDFRDMVPEINKLRKYIEIASKKYPEVKFRYLNALEAARKHMNFDQTHPKLNVNVSHSKNLCRIEIKIEGEIFGSQPFFCVKTFEGKYIWENLDKVDDSTWSFTFDWQHIDPNCVEIIGLAVNSPSGASTIMNYEMQNKKKEFYYCN